MGYTIKQKIEICLKLEANPQMTQTDLANWAMKNFGSDKPPSQTTISRILSSKNDILGAKESEFLLVRRRKVSNPLLRRILTEWITQARWEKIPITTPIIQLTANAIWTRLPQNTKKGNGVFNHKWCNHFVKKLNINLSGSPETIKENVGYPLNKVWQLDEKIELKQYVAQLISSKNYLPQDLFTIDEFLLLYSLPLDQIFDVSYIDKGLAQSNNAPEHMLTIMLGCNLDGSEKLNPLVVAKHDTFDVSASSHPAFKSHPATGQLPPHALANKISEVYQISYKFNDNKWITSSIFQNYLLSLDHKIDSVSPDRNILIFLDNSSSHRIINLEFKHIKLIYMENASKHKNPYNGSFKGMKFDYIPMSFGIVDEFKILFRLQQYLEMINKQRNHTESEGATSPMSRSQKLPGPNSSLPEILSEGDYQVPFIKVIEWVKRSWDSISQEKIFLAWKKTFIISFKNPWPASNPKVQEDARLLLASYMTALYTFDPQKSFEKLKEIMNYLNVVIPWDIEELIGLVNERSKVSLNYVSIDEIIGSCMLGAQDEESEPLFIEEPINTIETPQNNWFSNETTSIGPSPSVPRPMPITSVPYKPPNHTPDIDLGSKMIAPSGAPNAYLPHPNKLPAMNTLRQQNEQEMKFNPHAMDEYQNTNPNSISISALLLASEATSQDMPIPGGAFSPLVPGREMLPPVLARPQMDPTQYRKHRISGADYNEFPGGKRPSVNRFIGGEQGGLFNDVPTPPQNPDSLQQQPFSTPGPSKFNVPSFTKSFSKLVDSPEDPDGTMDEELAKTLSRVIEASKTNGIKLSNLALEELKYNLLSIQRKYPSG
ncbi:hypothetical protein PUMCH_001244 [Australozyma saopauloensis]|uniref:HTH CENPB-type domain-containing protein n=1 Tax=Australozyma saopauloensis TaxID=291208 RepID=A0AAX4H671_9ASCO|nr:hypothetical protein PUMCH_001244 [[Candida] saopauloensis]